MGSFFQPEAEKPGWSKLPRGILGVWRLANGRLERPNNRGLWRQTASLNALTTNACGQSAWWKLPRGMLGVWRLANGRIERPNSRGLRRQTAGLNALTTKPVANVPECLLKTAARDFRGLKAGKRQAWTPWQQRAMEENGRLEHSNNNCKQPAWTL